MNCSRLRAHGFLCPGVSIFLARPRRTNLSDCFDAEGHWRLKRNYERGSNCILDSIRLEYWKLIGNVIMIDGFIILLPRKSHKSVFRRKFPRALRFVLRFTGHTPVTGEGSEPLPRRRSPVCELMSMVQSSNSSQCVEQKSKPCFRGFTAITGCGQPNQPLVLWQTL